jgi:protein SCO1/2
MGVIMDSKWVKFLGLAIVGLGLGAAFALLPKLQKTAPVAPTEQVSAQPSEGAAPAVAGSEIPATPVIEGAPPMPETTGLTSVATPAPVAGSAITGAFSLTDHHGVAVTEKSYAGKYKLVFFGFTNCPAICPATLQKISTVMENYDATGAKLAPLFITTDVERDTQDVMAAYVAKYNANIIGLTGTPEQIKTAEESYKIYATKTAGTDDKNYMMDHSSYVYLMSPDDQLLEIFSAEETAEAMIAKIKTHTESATGGATAPAGTPDAAPAGAAGTTGSVEGQTGSAVAVPETTTTTTTTTTTPDTAVVSPEAGVSEGSAGTGGSAEATPEIVPAPLQDAQPVPAPAGSGEIIPMGAPVTAPAPAEQAPVAPQTEATPETGTTRETGTAPKP